MDLKINNIFKTYAPDNVKKNDALQKMKQSNNTSSTGVELGNTFKEYQNALKAVKETSDVREVEVTTIKKQINNGTYSVNINSLADKMLQNLVI